MAGTPPRATDLTTWVYCVRSSSTPFLSESLTCFGKVLIVFKQPAVSAASEAGHFSSLLRVRHVKVVNKNKT